MTDDRLYRGLSEVIVGLCLGTIQPHAAIASEQPLMMYRELSPTSCWAR